MTYYFAKASTEQYPRIKREMLQDNSARRELMRKYLRIEDITADKEEGILFTMNKEKSEIHADCCGNISFNYNEYGGTADYLRDRFQEFFRIKLVKRRPFVRSIEEEMRKKQC